MNVQNRKYIATCVNFAFLHLFHITLTMICILKTYWISGSKPSSFCLNNPRSVVAYKQDYFRNMASENSREALGVRDAFSYVDIGKVRVFESKNDYEI